MHSQCIQFELNIKHHKISIWIAWTYGKKMHLTGASLRRRRRCGVGEKMKRKVDRKVRRKVKKLLYKNVKVRMGRNVQCET